MRSSRRAYRLACACLLLVCTASPAAADALRIDVVASGALGFDPNDRCEREASDVVGCSPGFVYPTFEGSIEARLVRWLGVGAFGGVSHQRSNTAETRDGVQLSGTDDRLLRMGAELKLHPFAVALPGAWVGASAGLAKLYGSSDQRGALLGGSFGVDWTLFDRFVLGVGTRIEHLAIGGAEVIGRGLTVGAARYASGVRVWVGARVGVTF